MRSESTTRLSTLANFIWEAENRAIGREEDYQKIIFTEAVEELSHSVLQDGANST